MTLLSYIWGNITAEVTCADPEKTLCAFTDAGIELSQVKRKSEMVLELTIPRKNYDQFCLICQRKGNGHTILYHGGLYWTFQRIKNRPILLFGFMLLLLAVLILPTRIFFVTVQGNTRIPTRQILYAAQDSGISFGMSRRNVRSEKVKNTLLSILPQLRWVGINTRGCTATISVHERDESTPIAHDLIISSICADQDGYILSMTVTKGNPLCEPGQYVKNGQVLVSAFTDCGSFIRAEAAEAEIIAQTNRVLEITVPSERTIRTSERDTFRKYSLIIGKKRIKLWQNGGIPDASCGRMYEELYLSLPGGFRLPAAICIDTYTNYKTRLASINQSDIRNSISNHAICYLQQQMRAGIVLSKAETFYSSDGSHTMQGYYTCREVIGRVHPEIAP